MRGNRTCRRCWQQRLRTWHLRTAPVHDRSVQHRVWGECGGEFLCSILSDKSAPVRAGLSNWGFRGHELPFDLSKRGRAEFKTHGQARENYAAASRISFAVSSGRASMATWLAATSIVLALIALAIALWRVGWMARSAVATRYQLVLVF